MFKMPIDRIPNHTWNAGIKTIEWVGYIVIIIAAAAALTLASVFLDS